MQNPKKYELNFQNFQKREVERKMDKQKMKTDAFRALMVVVFMISIMCIEAQSIAPYLGAGTSALALALMN